MNKERRKRIDNIIAQLNDIKEDIEILREEEQEAYDNMPESIQESDRGEAMTIAVDLMLSAGSWIEDAVSELEEVMA